MPWIASEQFSNSIYIWRLETEGTLWECWVTTAWGLAFFLHYWSQSWNKRNTFCASGESRKWWEVCSEQSGAENAKLSEVSAAQGLLCNFPKRRPVAFLGKKTWECHCTQALLWYWDGPHEAVLGWLDGRAAQPWGPHGGGNCLDSSCRPAWGPLVCRHSGLIAQELQTRPPLWINHLGAQLISL